MNPGWLGLDARFWGLIAAILGLMVLRHLIPGLMPRLIRRRGPGEKR